VLGAGTKLSYAADWSEYFGHHPDDGTGDVLFHLDPLWAHSAIDAIGVDAYIPLSDWRDGDSHLDAGQYDNIYELAYLQANIQGAEGYDWYYASPADREAQNRSSITDGLAGKPWVFRYKDFYNWWSSPHFNRVNGAEVSNPTPFVPQSKPFWFCEIGCPAIDKGANQPNVFYDPKSSESFVPYFSDGTRNDLIQRRYIEAFLDYYNQPVHNPVSTQYMAPMIDQAWSSIWCWDTRPFPDFPARMDVWADGDNWTTGHWLNGRIGLVALADIIFDLALDSGLENVDVSAVSGMVSGYMVERPMSGRASLSPLLDIYGVDLVETAQGLVFSSSRDTVAPISLSENDLIMNAEGETVVLERLDASDQPLDVRINYIDQQHDYQGASVYARDQFAQSVHILDITAPLVLDKTIGKTLAETRLKNRIIQSQTLRFTVPISAYALECADIITFDSLPGHWQIIELDGQGERRVTARRMDGGETVFIAGGTDPVPPDPPIVVPWISEPAPHVLDLPNILRDVSREGPLVGVELSPWSPGLVESGVGTSVRLIRPVAVGQILHDLPAGPVAVFDHQSLDIHLPGVQLASLPTQVFLNGGNMFALETAGGFEIFQAQFADLTGDETYRLSGLLRGLGGSDHLMMPSAPSGANLYYLSRGWQSLALSPAIRNADIELTFSTDGRTNTQMVSFPYLAEHLRPVSPVSLAAKIEGADIRLSWIRRSRIGGDDWNAPDIVLGETIERYRVEVLENGAPIWSEDISENMCTVPISDLEPFLGPGFSQITFRVAQISEIFGPGTPRTAVILL
ncbi:MAG TPA: hypothetical protein ENJ42_03745, partial [Hellea balneolensis]|nr:hypothetical protein [Hellea balneolensis]